jgi:prevent-host-death family protein
MAEWALQDAKNRLSQLVNDAVEKGPQTITRRGRPTAVVLSVEQFNRLNAPSEDIVTFLLRSPLADLAHALERDRDTGRDVEL